MKKIKNLSKYLLGLAILLFFALRLPQVLSNEFPFVFDMGRDHIWVRNMIELRRPTLIGPWGSLAGIYFGPAWYYLLSIPYIISGGMPQASVVWVMLLNLLALIIGFKFLKKTINQDSPIIFFCLCAFAPQYKYHYLPISCQCSTPHSNHHLNFTFHQQSMACSFSLKFKLSL